MKKHTKIYLDAFGYGEQDFIPCERCLATTGRSCQAVDVHHIDRRGMGGSKGKDHIGNLIGLCRACHIKVESNREEKQICMGIVKRRKLTATKKM